MSRVPKSDRPLVNEAMEKLSKPGARVRTNFRYQLYDNQPVRWYQMNGRSMQVNEELIYFTCLSDITQEIETENKLRTNRQMYEVATQLANLSVWVYDIRNNRIIFSDNIRSNVSMKEFGMPAVIENATQTTLEWIEEDDHPQVLAAFEALKNGAPSASCEYWYKRTQGHQPRCEKVVYTTVYDDSGEPVSAYAVGQNITTQRLEEQKFNSIYEQFAKINPNSLGTFRLNLTKNWCGDGQSPFASVLAQQDEGTVDAYLAANREVIANPFYQKAYDQIFTREKLIEAFENGKSEISLDYPVINSQNTIIWISAFINMLKNPNNKDIEAVTYALNINDKKIEESIVDYITENKYDFIALINPINGDFQLRNTGWIFSDFEPYHYYDYQDICDKIYNDYLVPGDRRLFKKETSFKHITSVLNKKNESVFIFRSLDNDSNIQRKQVTFSWLDISKTTIIITQRDITDVYLQQQIQLKQTQDALESAKQANASKSEFLSRMSHDIRTPLNGIIGMTHIAHQFDNPLETNDCLNKIDTSSKFLLGLINDVLDMSKAESGQIELHPEPYLVSDFNNYINAVIKPLCSDKNQNLVFEVHRLEKMIPVMDILRVNQIYFNLLSNAIKYTPEGGVIKVRVDEKLIAPNRDHLQVSISDSGIGMSEAFQKVLFQPFTQENRNDVSEMRGSGLGLAIVKKIIDAMNGKIEVHSDIGQGTTFKFTIDVDCVRANQIKQKQFKQQPEDIKVLEGKHILLCEDHPLNQEIAVSLLEAKGMKVEVAENGQEGVACFTESNINYYDAILMDIRMPIVDGYGATKQIRALSRSDAKTIPIIAMSADAFADDVRKCLNVGMNGHVAKPIDPDAFYEEILKYI